MTDNDHNSHSPINPNTLPNFATMPNVATMHTSHVNKEQPPFILVDGSYYLLGIIKNEKKDNPL